MPSDCFGCRRRLPPRAKAGGAVWLGAALLLASAAGAVPVPQGPRLLQPFDYEGVTLEPGPLRRQLDEVRHDYLRLANDDLLKPYRTRAGLPAPGRDLAGWYRTDTFHVFGQIISGLARLYAASGDPACRAKADFLVAEWAKCIAPDGYFYAAPKPNAPHYIYDKMMWGLLDDYHYCGNRAALTAMSRITDWALQHLERSRKVNDTSTEWYTLSENLERAYLATGDPKYRAFAQVWEYHDYWDIYGRGGDIFGPRPDGERTSLYHAYSHVNTLGGAGATYLVGGDRRYLEDLKGAAAYLLRDQVFATGGFGPDEALVPPAARQARLIATHNTFETQCGSWAVFKLVKYLLAFTGDARYGDWVERLVVNGIGATIPMTPDGHVFYYSDYCPRGGAKRLHPEAWTCCTGTRPQAVADYDDLIYFHDAHDVFVNLYAASTLRWERDGVPITLRQSTRFPEVGTVRFDVTVPQAVEFALKLRAPAWLAAPLTASVNDQPATMEVEARHWATLRRRWSDHDQVTVTLPMGLWASPLAPGQPFPTAVLYGPTVLALHSDSLRALRTMDLSHPARSLVADPASPLRFHVASNPAVWAQPFYAFGAGDPYFLYLDPSLPTQISPAQLRFQGQWADAGSFRFSREIGAAAECQFQGTGIRWLGYRYDDAGRAAITIDGQQTAVVDQFGPGRELPFDWSVGGLAPGRHTLRLQILPEKTAASRDHYLNVAGFEVSGDE